MSNTKSSFAKFIIRIKAKISLKKRKVKTKDLGNILALYDITEDENTKAQLLKTVAAYSSMENIFQPKKQEVIDRILEFVSRNNLLMSRDARNFIPDLIRFLPNKKIDINQIFTVVKDIFTRESNSNQISGDNVNFNSTELLILNLFFKSQEIANFNKEEFKKMFVDFCVLANSRFVDFFYNSRNIKLIIENVKKNFTKEEFDGMVNEASNIFKNKLFYKPSFFNFPIHECYADKTEIFFGGYENARFKAAKYDENRPLMSFMYNYLCRKNGISLEYAMQNNYIKKVDTTFYTIKHFPENKKSSAYYESLVKRLEKEKKDFLNSLSHLNDFQRKEMLKHFYNVFNGNKIEIFVNDNCKCKLEDDLKNKLGIDIKMIEEALKDKTLELPKKTEYKKTNYKKIENKELVSLQPKISGIESKIQQKILELKNKQVASYVEQVKESKRKSETIVVASK